MSSTVNEQHQVRGSSYDRAKRSKDVTCREASKRSELGAENDLMTRLNLNNLNNRNLKRYGHNTRPSIRADDDQDLCESDRGVQKKNGQEKEPNLPVLQEKRHHDSRKEQLTGSKTHKQSASQSAPVEETMQSTDGISHWGKKAKTVLCICDHKGITRTDDDILYKFKEGDFHRLQEFTKNVVIQRRVEDLQLGVESYQKKLNLTNPNTYRSNLRRKDAYTPYTDPRGFIYENKDKKNRLMLIDELHKFRRDGTGSLMIRLSLNDPPHGNQKCSIMPQTF
ncbi:hypothetical protein Tco_0152505 [Tanacetum coccineum]